MFAKNGVLAILIPHVKEPVMKVGVPQDTGIPRDGMIWAETGTRIQIPKTVILKHSHLQRYTNKMTPYLKLFRIFEVFSVKTPKQTSSSSSMLMSLIY